MFTVLDFIFIVVVLFSSATAYVSGFVHSIIGLAIWFGTAFITKYIYPLLEPLFARLLGSSTFFSNLVAYIIVFVLSVMILSFINKTVASKLHQTNFSSADKTFGFLFGLFRGIILMGIVYIIIIYFIPKKSNRPAWVSDAKSKHVLKLSAIVISSFVPNTETFSEVKEIIKNDLTSSDIATFEKLQKPVVDSINNDNTSAEMGYKDSEVRDLERQLQQLQEATEETILNDENKTSNKEVEDTNTKENKQINIKINSSDVDTLRTILKNNL